MTSTTAIQIFLTIIGSGAFFTFLQFLITRHDNKQEKAENNNSDSLRKEFKDNLEASNAAWKETYCDRNLRMITDLTEEVRNGLAAREEKGLERYTEHQETIKELKNAVLKLVDNDSKMNTYIESIGESLMGLSHDKLIYLTDKYTERGAITLKEKATIKSIYEPYKKLGGNGDCKVAIDYIETLPIISDEKAKEMDLNIKSKKYSKGGDY